MTAPQSLDSPIFPAVILAGGLSRRMGQSKSVALLADKPLLNHIIERLLPQAFPLAINRNDGALHPDLACIPDSIANHPGPLAGIASAMMFAQQETTASHVLTVPVDTPFIPHNLAQHLRNAMQSTETVVLARSNGRVHPVVGLWPIHLHTRITAWLGNPQNRKLMIFLESIDVVEVDFADISTALGPLDPFFNVNTPEDLARAELYLKAL